MASARWVWRMRLVRGMAWDCGELGRCRSSMCRSCLDVTNTHREPQPCVITWGVQGSGAAAWRGLPCSLALTACNALGGFWLSRRVPHLADIKARKDLLRMIGYKR